MLEKVAASASSADAKSLFVLFSTLVIGYWVTWIIYARFFHPLAKYPGPFLASISRCWIMLDVTSGKVDQTHMRLHKKYGPIVRIAPNEVTIADPAAIKTIYSTTAFGKTDFYVAFRGQNKDKYPDLFTNVDEQQHSERRKIVSQIYTMSHIVPQEEKIDKCTDLLIEQLGNAADKGKVIDLSDWTQWYAFDVIGELFFGQMFGFLKGAHDQDGYIQCIDTFMPLLAISGVMPSYARTLFTLCCLVIPSMFKAVKGLAGMQVKALKLVTARNNEVEKTGLGERNDMLESLIGIMREKGKKEDYDIQDVRLDAFAALGAGSDTTAASFTSIFYHLMRKPSAYTRLTHEIDEAYKTGKFSEPVKYNEAVHLPYLVACCKEGMRMHAAVGFTLPRYVPKGGCKIAGEWFPGGYRVGVNACVVQRDKSIFGEDAEEFVPERWFRDDATRMERHMLNFGSGARTCIGKNIVLCEMYKMIPAVLHAFNLRLENPNKEWETTNYWFNKPHKVFTVLEKR